MTSRVARFRSFCLGYTPTRRAQMNPPEVSAKYTDRTGSLTDDDLTAHLDGSQTWAASLIGRDGLSREGALDIDHDGEPAGSRTLRTAQTMGIVAYAITSENEDHDGGHVRCLFGEAIEPERIR